MKSSKLAISAAEWQLASSTEVILTKNKIIDNVLDMYGLLADDFREYTKMIDGALPHVFGIHPKISKGENYEGMPWVMLDYPRCFSKQQGHFAIRCFFWWGHFFSVSLQLSGQYEVQYGHVLEKLQLQHWYVGYTYEPWSHHLPNENWLNLNIEISSNPNASIRYAKAAKKIPVTEWPQVQFFFRKQFQEVLLALFTNH